MSSSQVSIDNEPQQPTRFEGTKYSVFGMPLKRMGCYWRVELDRDTSDPFEAFSDLRALLLESGLEVVHQSHRYGRGVHLWMTVNGVSQQPVIHINGLTEAKLKAAKQDDEGNVKAVSIETADGETYMVAGNKQGKELLGKVGKTVKATGSVRKQKDAKVLVIQKYEEVAGEDAPAEEPAEEPME